MYPTMENLGKWWKEIIRFDRNGPLCPLHRKEEHLGSSPFMVSLQDTASMPNTVTLLTGGSPWKKDGRSTTKSWGSNIMLLRLLHPRRGEKLQGYR
ncbi:hypothetical protein GW17_00006423 [Ensete ventricosum]|nr:hypothetical protein GW17_00006423 [Ensete ventricosum]RZS21836.1 hypothetical protein BHM03_00054533 [Ensete ventricosum]